MQYNTKTDEYYLLSSLDEVNVSFYLPKEVAIIQVIELDNNQEVAKFEYASDVEIVLDRSDSAYQIEAKYSDNTAEKLVIKVFEK